MAGEVAAMQPKTVKREKIQREAPPIIRRLLRYLLVASLPLVLSTACSRLYRCWLVILA